MILPLLPPLPLKGSILFKEKKRRRGQRRGKEGRGGLSLNFAVKVLNIC